MHIEMNGRSTTLGGGVWTNLKCCLPCVVGYIGKMLPSEKNSEPDWLVVQRQRKQEAVIGAQGGFPALIACGATVALATGNSAQVQTSIYLAGSFLAFLIWRRSKKGSALRVFGHNFFFLSALLTIAGFGEVLINR
jgi:hypothetical protein